MKDLPQKKRSLAQRIGEAGEALVKLWATKNLLSANKFDNDYGFDFTVQHFKPYGKHQIATGLFFFAQCKAVESEHSQYVKIEKSDAYLYLSASVPSCLLSVNNNSEIVKHRFIDEDLIDKLIKFIHGDNDSLNLGIDKWFCDTDRLQDNVEAHANISTTQKLKVYTAKKLLSALVPDSNISTTTTSKNSIVHLDTQWISNIINPDAFFVQQQSLDDIVDLNVIEILNKYLPSFNVLSISGSIGTGHLLSCKDPQNKSKCISYPHKGEISYRTKLGFVLTAGPCIKHNGQHVHNIGFDIKPSPYTFSECREDCLAFGEIFEKKQLAIDNHVLIPDLSTWKDLEAFFYIAKEIYSASQTGIFEFPDLHANEINSTEVSVTIHVLTSIINQKTLLPFFPGFIFNYSTIPMEELRHISESGKVPLAFTFKNLKYIAWIYCDYSWLLDDQQNLIMGFKFDDIKDIEVNDLNWDEREIPFPELWIEPSWPAIPIKGQFEKLAQTDEVRPFSISRD
jgi:hypothetical protein